MRSKRFSKTFMRYLLSYVFAFLIPLFFTFIFISNYVVDIYKSEILSNEKAQNVNFRDTVDILFQQIYNMAEQINIENEFKLNFNKTPYHRMLSSEKLYKYDFANVLVSNIAFFQNNIDVVVTSNGTCSKGDVYRFLFQYKNWPQDRMITELSQYHRPGWRPQEEVTFYSDKTYPFMSFIYPMASLDKNVVRTLLFQINKNDLTDILNSQSDGKTACVILNTRGAVWKKQKAFSPMKLLSD